MSSDNVLSILLTHIHVKLNKYFISYLNTYKNVFELRPGGGAKLIFLQYKHKIIYS
jgi:hypothetical protein